MLVQRSSRLLSLAELACQYTEESLSILLKRIEGTFGRVGGLADDLKNLFRQTGQLVGRVISHQNELASVMVEMDLLREAVEAH